jgi:hypothetical protein
MFQLGVFLVFIPQLFWFANHEPGQTAGWGDLEFQRHAASDANSVRAEPVAATSQDSRPSLPQPRTLASQDTSALDGTSLRVRGVVVAVGRDVEPLRGARISIAQHGTAVGELFSDSRGRFDLSVRDVANYTLQVSKAGFAPALIEGSGLEPRDPIVISLDRGAVVTGRVTDVLGEPVLGASVRVRRTDSGARRTAVGLSEFIAPTDDQGEYRIGSLPAGRYEAFLVSSGVVSPNARLTWSMLPSPAPSPPVILDLTTGEERSVHFTYQRSSRSTQPPIRVGPRVAEAVRSRVASSRQGNDLSKALWFADWAGLKASSSERMRLADMSSAGCRRGDFASRLTPQGFCPLNTVRSMAEVPDGRSSSARTSVSSLPM